MNITFAPKDILQIDDARIIHRNFSGAPSKFNREGERNFSVVIPNQELAEELMDRGWKVKIKPPRDEDEDPFIYMSVKIKFNDYGPNVYLESGSKRVKLTEDTVGCLDNIDIASVDLDIRPFNWEVQGNRGRAAYLQSIYVTQKVDRFAERYEERYSDQEPF